MYVLQDSHANRCDDKFMFGKKTKRNETKRNPFDQSNYT